MGYSLTTKKEETNGMKMGVQHQTYKANGTIDRYKVRLVAKGYTQTYGVHY